MSECKGIDIGCRITEMGSEAAGSAIDSIIKDIEDTISAAVELVTTFWVHVPTGSILATEGVSGFLTTYLNPYVVAAAMVSMLIGIAKLAITQRGQHLESMGAGMARLILVSLMAIPGISLLASLADELSVGIIEASVKDGDFGSNLLTLILVGGGLGPIAGIFYALLIGIIATPVSIIQAMFMLVRAIMVPILAGTLTLSAAFWGTELGRQWFQKSAVWLVAFLAYKPAAAIIYASGFAYMGAHNIAESQSLNGLVLALFNFIQGMTLMGLAVLALPALIGFAIPTAGRMSSGGGSGMMFAASAAGIVASGAISNGRNGGAGATGGGGDPGPTGAVSQGGKGGEGTAGAVGGKGPAGSSGAAGAAGAAGVASGVGTAAKVVGDSVKHAQGAAESAVGNKEDEK